MNEWVLENLNVILCIFGIFKAGLTIFLHTRNKILILWSKYAFDNFLFLLLPDPYFNITLIFNQLDESVKKYQRTELGPRIV